MGIKMEVVTAAAQATQYGLKDFEKGAVPNGLLRPADDDDLWLVVGGQFIRLALRAGRACGPFRHGDLDASRFPMTALPSGSTLTITQE